MMYCRRSAWTVNGVPMERSVAPASSHVFDYYIEDCSADPGLRATAYVGFVDVSCFSLTKRDA